MAVNAANADADRRGPAEHRAADRRQRERRRSGEADEHLGAALPRAAAATAATSSSSTPATAAPVGLQHGARAGSPRAWRAGKKALVITTDQSRMHLGKPWEFVMGAGAAALLVSDEPRFLESSSARAATTPKEVSDLTRPDFERRDRQQRDQPALVHGRRSTARTANFLERMGEPIDYDALLQEEHLPHPFGGMTLRAHRALLRRCNPSIKKAEALGAFEQKSPPRSPTSGAWAAPMARAPSSACSALIEAAERSQSGRSRQHVLVRLWLVRRVLLRPRIGRRPSELVKAADLGR